jgi:CubicO group peptidase (beta-lactamase class C family)
MSKLKKITLIIVAVLVLAYLTLPHYVRQALIHQYPGIEDYKIFYNRVVEAGTYIPWEQDSLYNTMAIADSTMNKIESYEPVAFLVIQDEKILYEKYWEGYSDSSLSNSFSAAKSIIGLLVGAAIDDGYIKSVDQKVADFLPSFKEGGKEKISIKHLLTMSSGLDWDEEYASLFSPTTAAYYTNDLRKLVDKLGMEEEPGKRYYYRSIDSEVLAMIVQAATGKTISEYASEKYWKNIGAHHDALWCLDHKDGMEKAYCCFNSNARDFARWGQLMLNKGKWGDKQLVSETYLDETTTPANYLTEDDGLHVDYYGYQWWIMNYNGYKIPYMRGILGQYVFAIPEKNAVVVRLGHKRSDELIGPNRKDMYVYMEAASQILR